MNISVYFSPCNHFQQFFKGTITSWQSYQCISLQRHLNFNYIGSIISLYNKKLLSKILLTIILKILKTMFTFLASLINVINYVEVIFYISMYLFLLTINQLKGRQ